MEKKIFDQYIKDHWNTITEIGVRASELHDIVCNQKYDGMPYSYHLYNVGAVAITHGHYVCNFTDHILPIIFGAYFHDAIEDARVTYNDVLKIAKTFMSEAQAIIATEIVYALTDEKGRNRAERGSEKHYEDIRETQYAPFVKFADRLANTTYSVKQKSRMADIYAKEYDDFFRKLGGEKYVPSELWKLMTDLFKEKYYEEV